MLQVYTSGGQIVNPTALYCATVQVPPLKAKRPKICSMARSNLVCASAVMHLSVVFQHNDASSTGSCSCTPYSVGFVAGSTEQLSSDVLCCKQDGVE